MLNGIASTDISKDKYMEYLNDNYSKLITIEKYELRYDVFKKLLTKK